MSERGFDLNIQKVLEHWSVPHGIREVLANALDETALTKTNEAPVISKDETGKWHIRDFGRGLRHTHFTQNENVEKIKNADKVIGKFGVGLKDALATFDRNGVQVSIKSKYGDISIEKLAKHGFNDVVTLHAIINDPSDPEIVGTEFIISGINDEDIQKAKENFLVYSDETILESTKYGAVIKKKGKKARIYVNGLFVAEEEKFLFSYNITSPTKQLLKALNRERTNVGRGAYSDRIKQILMECSGKDVVEFLIADLKNLNAGKSHDELQWIDVQLHACQILNASEKVLFVTASDLESSSRFITYAKDDGYRLVVIPDVLASKLPSIKDKSGNGIVDLNTFKHEWSVSFEFKFIEPDKLTKQERKVFDLKDKVMGWFPRTSRAVKDVLISETMQVNWDGSSAVGLWQPAESRIIIERSQLRTLTEFTGTLIHEITHALTGTTDETMEFEIALTQNLGMLANMLLK